MTISPAEAERRAVDLGRLYADAELALVEFVRGRLEADIDSPLWAEQKLADVSRLRREIEKQIEELRDGGARQLALAIEEAYETGLSGALADLAGAGIEDAFGRTNAATVEAFVNEAVQQLESTHLGIARQTVDAYREAVTEGSRLAAAGAETRRQAAGRVLDEFAKRGISGFLDSAGRRWEASTYAEMATRTMLGRSAVQGHLDTLQANGRDLVIVSDSPEECPLCRPWEGKVLSIAGSTTGDVPMGEGGRVRIAGTVREATSAGLFHPNCTHRLGLFVPGLTRRMRDTPNPDGYEDRQRQRYMERNVRQWKRREAAAMSPEQREYAKRHRKEWQRRLREFTEEKDRRRLYYREQIDAAI